MSTIFIIIFTLSLILINTLVGVYVERKVSAFIQDRIGPTETGKFGLLQTFADVVKLLFKEDVISKNTNRFLFKFAPILVFMAVFAGFAIVPFSVNSESKMPLGILIWLGIVALDVIGILMAGWASSNKFSLYGAVRSLAQMVSYELPLGLSILCVVVWNGSLDLQEISLRQGIFSDITTHLFGISFLGIETQTIGGILSWNIISMPFFFIVFLIFFISGLAQANRTPFDIPEAESELVAGFQTEYSGMRWAFLMLAEYGMMLLIGLLTSILFFGGWNSPFPNIGSFELANYTTGEVGHFSSYLWSFFWLMSKTFIFILIQMWIRWSFPRLRVDQLMTMCWKYLLPFSLGMLLLTAFWKVFL
ncbi:complex I subunit 1/NuoH family protein [Bernardetia sp.]|uniref:complex I subunit 1/NuoH family protein n=1 Tax=Bernardetia sp. TaxID=1937974 RepID=UPI0025C1560F|nr:complex I subunit 1 family protein [Bernardetia sp.]